MLNQTPTFGDDMTVDASKIPKRRSTPRFHRRYYKQQCLELPQHKSHQPQTAIIPTISIGEIDDLLALFPDGNPKPASRNRVKQHPLDLSVDLSYFPSNTLPQVVTIDEIDELLGLFSFEDNNEGEWTDDEVYEIQSFVMFRSVSQMLYLKSNTATRDDIWEWIQDTSTFNPFSFANCALSLSTNPHELRLQIQHQVNSTHSELARSPTLTAKQQSLFDWLASRRTTEIAPCLNSVEYAAYRLSLNFINPYIC